MDDVDFILGQYDEGKGVSKKGLTFVFKLSLIEHIPFAMLRMTYVIYNLISCQPYFEGEKD